jgi:hypothetical protein
MEVSSRTRRQSREPRPLSDVGRTRGRIEACAGLITDAERACGTVPMQKHSIFDDGSNAQANDTSEATASSKQRS